MAAMSGVSLDKVTRYSLIALMGYTAYRLAAQGSLGAAAKKAADEIGGAWGGSPGVPGIGSPAVPVAGYPSAPSAPSGSFAVSLRDLGGQPLVYDTSRQTLRQAVAGGNVYSAGDVFAEPSDGRMYQYVGGGYLVNMATGQRMAVTAFALAV